MMKIFLLLLGLIPVAAAPVPATLPDYQPQPVDFPRAAPYLTADGAVAIVGYNDMQGMLEAINARFASAHPGFKFALTLKGTRTAPAALARGTSAFAPMGAEFSPEQRADYRAVTGGDPRCFRIAHCSLSHRALSGPVAIIAHRDNPLAALTLPQVKQIFEGGAARWDGFGLSGAWSARGVHPAGLRAELALGLYLRERLALGTEFGTNFQGFAQSAEVVTYVASDPLAIGFAAINRVTPGVKVLAIAPGAGAPPVAPTEAMVCAGRYPLDRFLLIYARQPLDPFVREYLRLVLSREGQAAIAADALGYLPLNPDEAAAEREKL